ncbi:MAG: NAD-dependent epimerase/dehydratase family protein, partial [Methanobacteriota archaeon]
MKNILVLGGAGFIGSALIVRLVEMGCNVSAVDRYWSTKVGGVDCISGDVFDSSLLIDVMKGKDIVYHLVSTTIPSTSNRSPSFDCETNVLGSLRILDAMVE